MIKAIIFDCFGVFYPDPVFAFMRDSQTPREKANALHELDKRAAYGELNKADFIEQAATILSDSQDEIEKRFFHGKKRNQSLVDFAQQARKDYKIALLSNIGGDMMDGFFSKEELASLFDVVVLSGNVKMAKPDRAIFEYTLNKLGVAPDETIFIDDSTNHTEGAKKLEIQSIQFSSNKQLKADLATLGVDKTALDILQ